MPRLQSMPSCILPWRTSRDWRSRVLSSNRLASYTEKSTRYQKWRPDDFYVPSELTGHPLVGEYMERCRLLFSTYIATLDPVRDLVLSRAQRRQDESDEALDRRIRSQYVDVCRFLLPASALANVGMTANARVLENVIRKMLSHELEEVRQIGEQVKAVAREEVPTLVKYAEAVAYLSASRDKLSRAANELPDDTGPELLSSSGDPSTARRPVLAGSATLLAFDPEGENRILAAALYRHAGIGFAAALDFVASLDAAARESLSRNLLGDLGEHDIPLPRIGVLHLHL